MLFCRRIIFCFMALSCTIACLLVLVWAWLTTSTIGSRKSKPSLRTFAGGHHARTAYTYGGKRLIAGFTNIFMAFLLYLQDSYWVTSCSFLRYNAGDAVVGRVCGAWAAGCAHFNAATPCTWRVRLAAYPPTHYMPVTAV